MDATFKLNTRYDWFEPLVSSLSCGYIDSSTKNSICVFYFDTINKYFLLVKRMDLLDLIHFLITIKPFDLSLVLFYLSCSKDTYIMNRIFITLLSFYHILIIIRIAYKSPGTFLFSKNNILIYPLLLVPSHILTH